MYLGQTPVCSVCNVRGYVTYVKMHRVTSAAWQMIWSRDGLLETDVITQWTASGLGDSPRTTDDA